MAGLGMAFPCIPTHLYPWVQVPHSICQWSNFRDCGCNIFYKPDALCVTKIASKHYRKSINKLHVANFTHAILYYSHLNEMAVTGVFYLLTIRWRICRRTRTACWWATPVWQSTICRWNRSWSLQDSSLPMSIWRPLNFRNSTNEIWCSSVRYKNKHWNPFH